MVGIRKDTFAQLFRDSVTICTVVGESQIVSVHLLQVDGWSGKEESTTDEQ